MVNMTCPTIPDKPSDPKPFLANGQIDFKAHDVGWLVCGIMALIATISSSWLIWKHLTYYTCPQQQRHIVRLLVMVPIYAIVSFASYLFYEQALYYQTIRDCYEAVLVTSFFYLILAYTGDTRAEQHAVFRNIDLGDRFWVWPLARSKYRPEGLHFLWLMKISVLQYAIVRPLCTFVAVGTQYFGYYCLHSWMPWFAHAWCAVLISISVTVAMYCLIQLYMPVRKLVDPYKPVLKFLSIKTIVFLTFWQDTLLSFLVSFGAIKETEYFTAEQIQAGINALLQCFWMLLFGFIHIKAFSYLPYRPEDRRRTTMRGRALLDSLDFRDWFHEMKESTRYVAARSKGRNCTLAEDLRAQRHEHLLNAFGKHRTANLEMEIDIEKANLPTFWKNPQDAHDDDKYTSLPSPAKASAARQGSKVVQPSPGEPPVRDSHAQRAAELQRLVAELDLQNVDQSIVGVQDHDYGYEDERYERAALIHQSASSPSPSPDRTFRALDSPGKDGDDKHPELTQYHAPTVQLANVPSLTYEQVDADADAVPTGNQAAAHARHSSRTAPGVGAFGIASWFGWNNSTQQHDPQPQQHPQQQQQRTSVSAADGCLRPGEAYGADAQPRTPDGEGTGWWRNYWDRVSHAGSHEPSVAGMEEADEREPLADTAQPAVMRQVTAGSWGIENTPQPQQQRVDTTAAPRPLPSPPALSIDTHGQHRADTKGETSLDSTTSPSSSSLISPHVDSPLSRLIQSSRDSFSSLSRDEVRELQGSTLSSSARRGDTTAGATIRAVPATSRPTVAPRASSFAASSKQASVSRVTSTTTRSGALIEQPVVEEVDAAAEPTAAAKTLPPAVGPKGKLFNLVLPSPLSPARYPYGKEGDAAPANASAPVQVEHSATSRQQQVSEANEGGTLKWANQSSRPAKPSSTEPSPVEAPIQLPKGKNVITVGGMSLAQAKAAQEKAEAEALSAKQQQQQQQREATRPALDAKQQQQPKSILLESASSRRVEGKLVLPAPSRFAGVRGGVGGGEDPYVAGRSAVVDDRPPAAAAAAPPAGERRVSAAASSAQTRGSSTTATTTFKVGSIVPRQAVRASAQPPSAPLRGYYDSLRRSNVDAYRGAEQQQQAYVPAMGGPPHPQLHYQQRPQQYGQVYAPQPAQFAPQSRLRRPQHAPPPPLPMPRQYAHPYAQPQPAQPRSQFQFEYYRD